MRASLEQLAATLRAIEAEAADELVELRAVNAQNLGCGSRSPERLHLTVIALRVHVEQEIAIEQWARWAQD